MGGGFGVAAPLRWKDFGFSRVSSANTNGLPPVAEANFFFEALRSSPLAEPIALEHSTRSPPSEIRCVTELGSCAKARCRSRSARVASS